MNEAISSLGLLIVFITVLFNVISKDVDFFLSKDIYGPSTPNSHKIYKKFQKIIWLKTGFLILLMFFVSYLLLPSVIDIILSSDFSLWHFDIDKTLFVAVELFLIVFTVFSFELFVKLVKQYKLFKQKK